MTSIFDNLSVDADALPRIEEIDFKPIEKKYLRVLLISSMIFWFVLLAGAFCIAFFGDIENSALAYAMLMGSVLLLATLNLLFTKTAFKKKKYALRERDIIYCKGLWWSTRISIPFNRIQHAELKQGPFERFYGLHSLKVYTAGGHSSDLVIPGLKEENAQAIKDFILGKTSQDGSESEH